MNSNKYIAAFVLVSLTQISLLAQSIINLNAPETGTKIHAANQKIVLSNGYKYKAAGTSKVNAYINPSLLGGISYTGTAFTNLEQRQINTSYQVGLTQGSASVTALGGASYSIPFSIPEGIMGMRPSLGIAYNSQAGNGLLGYGWNLSAGSVITRAPQTWYYNRKNEGVLLTNADVFVLDGIRLTPISGSNGANGTIYATEQESFSKITSLETSGTGPLSFKVETKDGKTIEYGIDEQSRDKWTDGNTVIVWYIRKVTDLNGNYLEYKYAIKEGQLILDEILYTGNSAANLAPNNKVKFFYNRRNDINSSYIFGKEVKSNLLLDRVSISTEGNIFRQYQFVYTSNVHSFLSEVFEIGSDGSRFNSTAFQYGEKQLAVLDIPTFGLNNSNKDVFSGDYNGDGKTDLMAASYIDQNVGGQILRKHTNIKVYSTNDVQQFELVADFPFPPDFSIINSSKDEGYTDRLNFFSADFNGDGKDDFILTKKYYDGTYIRVEKMRVYYGGENMDFSSYDDFYPQTDGSIFNISHPIGSGIFIGDFDGDKFADFMTVFSDGSGYKAWIYSPRNGNITKVTGLGFSPYASGLFNIDFINMVDFDGDGKTELMLTDDLTTTIYEFQTVSSEAISSVLYQSGFPTKWHTILTGDFNGDGKTDLLTETNTGVDEVSYSTGKAFAMYTIGSNLGGFKVGDYNGDSKSDIIINTGILSQASIKYSIGIGFTNSEDLNYSISSSTRAGDFNGDGKSDEVLYKKSQQVLVLFNYNSREMFLHKMADGMNNITEFEYKNLTDQNFFYRGELYYMFFTSEVFPLYAVSKMTVSDGVGGKNATDYSYRSLIFHRGGKGFLGFREIVTANAMLDQETWTVNDVDNPFFIPQTIYKQVKRITDDKLLSKVYYRYYPYTDFPTLNTLKRQWLPLRVTTETDLMTGVTVTSVNEFNNDYGNLSKKTTSISVGNSTKKVTVVQNTFGRFGTWIESHPVATTTTTTLIGESPYTRAVNFSYDTKGNLTGKTTDPADPKSTTTVFQFNNMGLPTSETVSATGNVSIGTSIEYDSKGRIKRKYNSQNQFEEFTYDGLGRGVKVQDILGLITTFSFDGFGRSASVSYPMGGMTVHSLSWDIKAGNNTGATDISTIYFSSVQGIGKAPVKVWYDEFSREKITMSDEFQKVYSFQTYDSKGNKKITSAPYIDGQTPVKTIYDYDDFNRIVKETTDGIIPTAHNYLSSPGNTTVSVSGPQGTSTSIIDATGKTVSVTDNGGTLLYKYYSSGNLKSVSVGALVVASMEYDIKGNRTKLIDKNAGTIVYQYDNFDNLVTQTENGKVTSLQYDMTGKVTQKNIPEGTITYEYNTTGKAINNIKKISGPNGVSLEYFYSDDFGRLIKVQEQIGSELFINHFEYDNLGNQTKMIYPSGFSIKKHYTSKGEMYKITDDSEQITIWQRTSKNALGKYTQYVKGDGKITKNEFDNYGSPLKLSAAGVYELQMTFNTNNGNLLSRKDITKNLTENFTYDNLNRLTSMQVLGQPIVNVSYAPNGNILNKGDVGAYSYDQNKINAVTKITAPNPSDLSTSSVSVLEQNVEYTSSNKIKIITEGDYEFNISYGVEDERKKSVLKMNGTEIFTRYYLPSYEKTVEGSSITESHFINGPDGVIAMYIKENGVGAYYYIYIDHLGTPVAVTNSAGTVVYQQSFDAWGRRRNSTNWTNNNVVEPPKWLRGYTGHECLSQFALINMNGRVYDPIIARMLNADNYVQAGGYSQGFNRYSYCSNNPLKYTDPSGQLAVWDDVIVAGAGFTIGYVGHGLSSGDWGKEAFIAGGFGAATALLGYYTFGGYALAAGGSFQTGAAFAGKLALTSVMNSVMPSIPVYQSSNMSVAIKPSWGFGSSGATMGIGVDVNYSDGIWNSGISANFGLNEGMGDLTGKAGGSAYKNFGVKWNYDIKGEKWGMNYSENTFFGGNTNQGVGAIGLQLWKFSIRVDEDFIWDGGDRFRTGGLLLTGKINNNLSLAFGGSMITGQADNTKVWREDGCGPNGTYAADHEYGGFRGGIVYGGIIYKQQAYFGGINNDQILHGVQNWIHRGLGNSYFENHHLPAQSYGYYGTYNPYYLYY